MGEDLFSPTEARKRHAPAGEARCRAFMSFIAENSRNSDAQRYTCVSSLREIESLITMQVGDCSQHIGGLRQDCVFQLRGVGDERVHGCYPANGCIEVFEQLA